MQAIRTLSMVAQEETKLAGSVSLTEEVAPETGQYHLHEQIGEGACEQLPLERTSCP